MIFFLINLNYIKANANYILLNNKYNKKKPIAYKIRKVKKRRSKFKIFILV